MVVQKARKQGTVLWFDRILQQTVLKFPNRAYLKNVGLYVVGSYQMSIRTKSEREVQQIIPRKIANPDLVPFHQGYLVSLLFAPPILHPTNHFLDREVF